MKILNLFQNDSWKAFVSFLVWRNKDNIDNKDEFSKEFDKYLPILIQYVTLAFLNGNASINVIKEIVFKMNVKLKINESFPAKQNIPSFENFLEVSRNFDSRKTKYILFLYAYVYDDFKQVIDSGSLEVEHILPKQWQNANFNEWDEQSHFEYLENIGNKISLPKKSNIKCIDNFFAKKQIEYSNSNNANLKEVLDLSKRTKNIWTKEDIDNRAQAIYSKMVEFLQG
ncbi:HNH endonuclease family protein [Campylobacter coli]